jgi:ABC-type transport system substrate-binding protein
MSVRRFLIFAPTAVLLFLLQSYFWVPSYEEQTRGNPGRLKQYITASIGDATILNPVLSADSASSDIESMVFEGLIDRDEALRFRGRLATSWEIYEEAFFYVNEAATLPGVGKAGGQAVVDLIRRAKDGRLPVGPKVKTSLDNVREILVLPARTFSAARRERSANNDEETDITIRVQAPARVKLVLKQVDQDLFTNLTAILGKDYFSSFNGADYLNVEQEERDGKRPEYAKEILPATEHNPVVVFYLRPGVKFHDGHVFDANDVKFTFEAIMDPKNLSPRVADYEPVKCVEVMDPLTVRVVYKRLYSPALDTWGMGILP